jgi:hypothetical protein
LEVQKSYRDQLNAAGVETSKSLPTKFGIPKPKELVSCMHARAKKLPFREKLARGIKRKRKEEIC